MSLFAVGVMCFVFVFRRCGTISVSDEEYSTMPPVFHLDNFDDCLMLGEGARYCFTEIQLAPLDPKNESQVWKIIKKISGKGKNYRHDKLRHGICLPKACPKINKGKLDLGNEHSLKSIISDCYMRKYENLGVMGSVTQMHCETKNPFYNIDTYDIIVGFCLMSLMLIIVYASFYEGMARYKTKEEYNNSMGTSFGKTISCFSIPKNWKRLSNSYTSPDAHFLRCIQGVRFFNMLAILASHIGILTIAAPVSNTRFAETMTDDPQQMLFVNGTFNSQTFFLISAWLLSYHFFLIFEKEKGLKLKYLLVSFINRYVRLTPCLLVVVAISATWGKHMGRGPVWDRFMGEEYRNCRKNWWTNLLYINNYYDTGNMCLIHTWYLAADVQLYLLSLIILAMIWMYQKHIKTIFSVSLIIAILIPGIINYVYDYDIVTRYYPEIVYTLMRKVENWHMLYTPGHANIGAYVIGLIFGYIFYKYRGQKIFTKKYHTVLWWLLLWVPSLSVIYLGIPIYDDNYVNSRMLAAIYVALARNIFALSYAIAIFGVTQGIGWFFRDCLVWSPLQTLGKLVYCVYLIHPFAIYLRLGQARSPIFVSNYTMLANTVGDFGLAFIFATILCLFVELPFWSLQKLYLPQVEELVERSLQKEVQKTRM